MPNDRGRFTGPTEPTARTWDEALGFLHKLANDPKGKHRDEICDKFASSRVHDLFTEAGDRQTIFKRYGKGQVDTVELFTQIIQKLLKKENEADREGFNEAFNVHKIEGYHYLTSKYHADMFRALEVCINNLYRQIMDIKIPDLPEMPDLGPIWQAIEALGRKDKAQDREIEENSKRIGKLEDAVREQSRRINDNREAIKVNKERIDENRRDIETNKEEIRLIWEAIKKLKERLVKLEERDIRKDMDMWWTSVNIAMEDSYKKDKKKVEALFKSIVDVFRYYTVIIYSVKPDGPAAENVPMTMGIFRLVGVFNGKPLYKKDEGEMYMYYLGQAEAWMVGPVIGADYGYLYHGLSHSGRSTSGRGRSHEDYGSYGRSDSYDDRDHHRGKHYGILPLMDSGWYFQPNQYEPYDEAKWQSDTSVKCEPLRNVEVVTNALRALLEDTSMDMNSMHDQVVDTMLENFDDKKTRK